MLGLILVPLVIGALVSSIWGKEAAQGCFRSVGNVFWAIVIVGSVVAFPPIGIILAIVLVLWFLIRYMPRFWGWADDTKEAIESERRQAEWTRQREAKAAREEAEARIAADPEAAPIGAFGPPQHCRPQPCAPTALPRPPKDAHYTATPVRDGDRIGYALVEHVSGSRVFLTVGEYGRDWVGCAPPPSRPTETPKPAAPQAPTWSAPTQPRRP